MVSEDVAVNNPALEAVRKAINSVMSQSKINYVDAPAGVDQTSLLSKSEKALEWVRQHQESLRKMKEEAAAQSDKSRAPSYGTPGGTVPSPGAMSLGSQAVAAEMEGALGAPGEVGGVDPADPMGNLGAAAAMGGYPMGMGMMGYPNHWMAMGGLPEGMMDPITTQMGIMEGLVSMEVIATGHSERCWAWKSLTAGVSCYQWLLQCDVTKHVQLQLLTAGTSLIVASKRGGARATAFLL